MNLVWFAENPGLSILSLLLLAFTLLLLSKWIRYIPNNRVGVVEKLISGKGSVKSGLIAMGGEAGFQPQLLRGGWHLLTPFQYRIHKLPLVIIPQGKIGYVFARDGKDLPPSQALASNAHGADFQDLLSFIQGGGEKGPQRQVLREGMYAINLAQFVVLTEDQLYYLPLDRSELETFQKMSAIISERAGWRPVIIRGADDAVGIVTVHDGPSLASGEIIALTVGEDTKQVSSYHNNFQDADKFLVAGGRRGRQYQVLVEGTYYINRLFATVELIPKTVVEVGTVGVVVSYTGEIGADISGQEYRHGELVAKGSRGVWSEPLLPGKYAFNTYAGKVLLVPTTNFLSAVTHRYAYRLEVDPAVRAESALFKRLAFEVVFLSPQLKQLEHKGSRMLRQLWDVLSERYIAQNLIDGQDFQLLPADTAAEIAAAADAAGRARLVCDFLAGMTDGYAARTYKRLFVADFGSIGDLVG